MRITRVPRERRHTLYFLREFRAFSPAFLDTELDMARVLEHRTASRAAGQRFSVVSYVIHTAARVIAKHPEANSAMAGRRRPRIAHYPSVNVKLAFDKTLNGQRIVLTAVLPEAEQRSLVDIQTCVDRCRDADPAEAPEFSGARLLHRLPWPFGPAVIRVAARPLARRASTLGTLAISSLGHRPVDGLHAMGGTTVTLGLGRILERPVVRNGEITIAPVMRLNVTFDHRVIDGAEAADILEEVKLGLEEFAGTGGE
jgi:pyruvate/2-oxoglutarate dehydrogenase complex dihydrolipoamide acyltransferase (E2) component